MSDVARQRLLVTVGLVAAVLVVASVVVAAVLPEDTRMIDQQGLLVVVEMKDRRSGETSRRLAFEPRASGGPFILLENSKLEKIEKEAPVGSGIEIRVSGTLTKYKGRNYLLLTRAKRVE